MKTIKTNMVLKDMHGAPLKSTENKDVLLGVVLSNLLGGKTSNPSLAWVLGKKFATEKTVDLKAEEVVFLKEEVLAVGMAKDGWLSGLLAGQIVEILESKDTSDDDEDEEESEPKPKAGKKKGK